MMWGGKIKNRILLTLVLLCAVCMAGAGCRKHDMRTVIISVPGMENQEHARIIQDAFIHHPGVKTVRPDIAAREVRVTYNSMVIAVKNLEHIIANAGFDANDIPAKRAAAAKSPPEP